LRARTESCLACGLKFDVNQDFYKPLRYDDEIRLLQLYPGTSGSDVIGKLVHVRLGAEPYYESISYTWADENGDATQSRILFITPGNNILKITSNCEAALRRFRFTNSPRYVWIDSVCINQSNLFERSEQVQIMRRIYQNANRVLVYIGTPDKDDLEMYDLLFGDMQWMQEYNQRTLSRGATSFSVVPCIPIERALQNSSTEVALRKFFSFAWFRRIWIIQEVIVARQVALFFGPFEPDWSLFSLILITLSEPSGKTYVRTQYDGAQDDINELVDLATLSPTSTEKHIPPVFRLNAKAINKNGASLLSLIDATRSCLATDPRDKIFALLGLVSHDSVLPLPRADYTKTTEAVFVEAARYCVQSKASLDLLTLICPPYLSSTQWWTPNFGNINALLSPRPASHYIFEGKSIPHPSRYPLYENPVSKFELQNNPLGQTYHTGALIDRIRYMESDYAALQAFQWDIGTTLIEFYQQFQAIFGDDSEIPAAVAHCFLRDPATDAEGNPLHCPETLDQLWSVYYGQSDNCSMICGFNYIGIASVGARLDDRIFVSASTSRALLLRPFFQSYVICGTAELIQACQYCRFKGEKYRTNKNRIEFEKCDCQGCNPSKSAGSQSAISVTVV
jgi:hypothetical protein